MPDDETSAEEFTIDELAARAHMTVRNVRAYAGRGLIAAPRLEGRTGYYSRAHLQRLQLIRELLERGFTLAAVEKAVLGAPTAAAGRALELITLLELPQEEGEAEVMSRDSLAALAGVPRNDSLIDSMVAFGLVEWLDDDHDRVRLLEPATVRAGAAAVSIGLDADTVIGLFPMLQSHLRTIADTFVREVSAEIVQPFVDADLPDDQWAKVLATIENLLPIASQVTLGIFRSQLRQSIDAELGATIAHIAGGTPPGR
jgi:DNA-binding transcriptional MerR regulator